MRAECKRERYKRGALEREGGRERERGLGGERLESKREGENEGKDRN